jgi:hypothetical protein
LSPRPWTGFPGTAISAFIAPRHRILFYKRLPSKPDPHPSFERFTTHITAHIEEHRFAYNDKQPRRSKSTKAKVASSLAVGRGLTRKVSKQGLERLGYLARVLLVPFPDDGQRLLDVFFRVGIGVGVKNLSVREIT